VNRILMIVFHYPPCRGSSGLQRTLSFSRYLPNHGWEPVVLTVKSSVHSQTSDDQMGDIPDGVAVERAFALDTKRDLGFRGRYLKWMALPDFWVSWFLWAVPLGLRLIRKYKPKVIWSTYPIATAHLIALALHRLTGIPWVADFRDPMIEINPLTGQRRPADRSSWLVWNLLERQTVKHCSRAVFTTEGALRIYADQPKKIGSCCCTAGCSIPEPIEIRPNFSLRSESCGGTGRSRRPRCGWCYAQAATRTITAR
jgi:Glycosyl transferase 4-like domain